MKAPSAISQLASATVLLMGFVLAAQATPSINSTQTIISQPQATKVFFSAPIAFNSGTQLDIAALNQSKNTSRLAAVGVHLNNHTMGNTTDVYAIKAADQDLRARVFGLNDRRREFVGDVSDLVSEVLEEKSAEIAGNFNGGTTPSYTSMAGAAAAISSIGYLKGSKALKKLGLEPSIKHSILKDRLRIEAQPIWGKKFDDIGVAATLSSEWFPRPTDRIQGEFIINSIVGNELAMSYFSNPAERGFSYKLRSSYNFQTTESRADFSLHYLFTKNLGMGVSYSLDDGHQSTAGITLNWSI